MFVKRYIVKDMPEAMEKIRKELGPDAVILSSRHIRGKGIGGFFKKKLLEVVVAYEPAPEKSNSKEIKSRQKEEVPKEAVAAAPDNKRIDQLNDKINELQDVVKDFTEKIKIVDKETMLKFSPEVTKLYNTLVSHDVNEELAKKLASDTQDITNRMAENPVRVMEQLILDHLKDPMQLKLKKYKTNVIILIGPTGVGKTTTLVKLAGMYAVEYGLKVGLINTDTFRVAAQQQLKTYSEIMDIPLCTVYAPEEMEEALKTLEDRDVILIDTAGKSSSDENYRAEIQAYLDRCNADEVLLTMSVVTGFNACKEIISNYAFLQDYKIIVTKTDEVSVWGNILNIVAFADKPLTYITVGQNVPDDIEQVDMAKITYNILGSVG